MVNAEKIFKYLIIGGIFLLLLTPLLVADSLFFPFITGKAFFFRIIVEIIFALWLCLLLFRKSNFPSASALLWGLLALVSITILATVFGVNPYRSFWSNFERMEGLITHLHLLAYFVVLISMFKNHRLWLWFFRASTAVATIVGIYGIFQLLGWLDIHQGGVRVDATLGNSAYLAVYLLIHVFITLWLICRDWSQRSVVYFYSAMLLVQLINLYHTATRGALIGLVGGLILTLLLIVWRAKDAIKLKKVSLSILIAIALLLVGFWLARGSDLVRSSSVLSRFSSISFEEIKSEARLSIWQISLAGFKERPVLGWGPENFVTVFSKYFRPELWTQEPWFDRSHNIFLDWLSHTGGLGLLAYLSLFASAIYYLWRLRADFLVLESSILTGLLAAYFIHNIFVFDHLVSYLLFFSVLAYIHFRSTNGSQIELSTKTNHAWPQPVFLLAGIVILVLLPLSLYSLNIKPILASQTLIKTFQTGDPNKKLLLFEQALAYKTFATSEIS